MQPGSVAMLSRQRSCGWPPAVHDVGSSSRGSGRRRSLGLSRRYAADEEEEDEEGSAGRASRPRWRALWRRIVRGNRRLFKGGGAAVRVAYDPCAYAQNFEEQGSAAWMEPENLSRSFSVRYANPSGVFSRF